MHGLSHYKKFASYSHTNWSHLETYCGYAMPSKKIFIQMEHPPPAANPHSERQQGHHSEASRCYLL
jgi:hypothetical protein